MRRACQRAHVQIHAYVNKIGHTNVREVRQLSSPAF